MKRRNATRSALFTSIISLLLCVSMLVGTTFAWFTDEVVSGTNVIAAGNLDIELTHTNSVVAGEDVEGATNLFVDENGKKILWEPGVVTYETFTVKNVGTLALKYNLAINFTGENFVVDAEGNKTEFGLSSALKVAVIDNAPANRAEAISAGATAGWDFLKDFNMIESLSAGENDKHTIVIYWEPGQNDNNWNVNNGKTVSNGADALHINLGIALTATQEMEEYDSFDKDYDEGATVAYVPNADGSATLSVPVAPAVYVDETTITAPAGTFDAKDKVEVKVETTNTLFEVTAGGATVASLNVKLTVNGEEVHEELEDGKVYTVTTYISKGLDKNSIQVKYAGDDGLAQPSYVSYNPETGELVFTTSHFSAYTVTATALAYDLQKDTALTTLEKIVDASKEQNNSVIIPEANEDAIEAEINKLSTEEDKQAAIAATAVAKIGEKTYATLADAFEAAQSGETITLVKNVVTSATITNSKNVTLDLNGKTIAGINSGTATHNDLFLVKGNLTVKNGTVTQTHVAANMGWNGCTNTFDVTAGGVLNLNGVTVENLGGTDMNFAVHMNNWGEVTLNVTNSTLKATYMPVRVFNSGPDMNNVKIEGTILESTGGNHSFWVHNYDSADFGGKVYSGASAAYDEAAVAARLNFEIYGNGNTFITGKDYPVRYGFNKSTYYTAEGGKVATGSNEKNDLPVANVTPYTETESIEWGNYGQWSPTEGLEANLEAAYTFTCVETGTEAAQNKYADWHCDFYVSLDRDLGENQIFLGGNYGSFGWIGFHNGDVTLKANEELPLLGSVTQNPWTYQMIAEYVGEFICGVGDVDDALTGATFTVMLRLTNPENADEFYNVAKITYTFK